MSALYVTTLSGAGSACVCAPNTWNSAQQASGSYLQIESDPAAVLQVASQNGTCVCGQFVNPADGSAVPSPFASGSRISQPVVFGTLNSTLASLDATNEQPVPLAARSNVTVSTGRSLVLTVAQPGVYVFNSSAGQTFAANTTNLTVVLPPSFLAGSTSFEVLAPYASTRSQIILTFANTTALLLPQAAVTSTQVAVVSSTLAVAGTALVGTVVYFGRAGRAFVAAPARLGGRRKFSL